VILPGGGDVVVGQELTDFNKGLDDGIEGEIFGFNMVDEAVDIHESASTPFAHYRPGSYLNLFENRESLIAKNSIIQYDRNRNNGIQGDS